MMADTTSESLREAERYSQSKNGEGLSGWRFSSNKTSTVCNCKCGRQTISVPKIKSVQSGDKVTFQNVHHKFMHLTRAVSLLLVMCSTSVACEKRTCEPRTHAHADAQLGHCWFSEREFLTSDYQSIPRPTLEINATLENMRMEKMEEMPNVGEDLYDDAMVQLIVDVDSKSGMPSAITMSSIVNKPFRNGGVEAEPHTHQINSSQDSGIELSKGAHQCTTSTCTNDGTIRWEHATWMMVKENEQTHLSRSCIPVESHELDNGRIGIDAEPDDDRDNSRIRVNQITTMGVEGDNTRTPRLCHDRGKYSSLSKGR